MFLNIININYINTVNDEKITTKLSAILPVGFFESSKGNLFHGSTRTKVTIYIYAILQPPHPIFWTSLCHVVRKHQTKICIYRQ